MDVEITELTAIDPESVHFVRKPANGFSPLLAKAVDEVEEVITESQAAQIASQRAGERIFGKSHDSAEYKLNAHKPGQPGPGDTLLPESTVPVETTPNSTLTSGGQSKPGNDTPSSTAYEATPPHYQDTPSSRIDASGSPSGSGTGQAEVDSIFASLCKEAEEVVDQAELLAAVIALKAEADYEDFAKGKYNADDKKKLLSEGKAMRNAKGDPSYPIADEEDLHKAIHAVGRGGASHNAVRKYIMKRARAMGKASAIPENWAPDGSIRKDMAVINPDGSMEIPGSPEWEAEDAKRLIEAGQCIATTIACLQASMDREGIEVSAGAADDQQDVFMLSDAINAMNYALGVVSSLAFREEVEAATNPEEGAMAKSLTEESVNVIRRSIFLAKALGSDNPAPSGSGQEEEEDALMAISKEDLVAAVSEGVGQGVQLALQKAEEDRLAREAAAATETPEVTEEVTKEGEEEPEPEADIAALVKGAVTEVVAPLQERLEKLEGTPASGGPLVGAAGAGTFTPGQRGGSDPATGATPEINDLRARIQKADSDGDNLTGQRLRKELGQRVLEVAWSGMGYPQSAARGRAAQFTSNAASA